MVDDIQAIVLSSDEEDRNDEAEPTKQTTDSQPQTTTLWPSLGAREVLAILMLTGLILVGMGAYGVSTGKTASLLGVFGSFRLFGADESEDTGTHERSHSATDLSLSEIEDTDTVESSPNTSAESSAATRARPEMSITDADGEREVDTLVKTLMRKDEKRPLPDASGIVAPIRRPLAATLEGIPQELTVLRRDVGPILVGITYNERTVDRLATVYDTMLVVAPHHEDALPEVLKYLPALIQTNGVSGLGSARTFTIPAPEPPGPEAESQATLKDLRGHKGEPLHPLARTEPDFLTVSAPPEWTGPARSVLSDYAPVIDIIEWNKDQIHVAGFAFESAITLPSHIVDDTPASDGDEQPVTEGNENPPNSETERSNPYADTQPEADGGEAQYGSGDRANTGTDAPTSGTNGDTNSSSGENDGKPTQTPLDRNSTTDSGRKGSGGTGGESVDDGSEDSGADDGGTTIRPDVSPGSQSSERKAGTYSTADGDDYATPESGSKPSAESDASSSTGQSTHEERYSSGGSPAGRSVDANSNSDHPEEGENRSQSPGDESTSINGEKPDSNRSSSATLTPNDANNPGSHSGGENFLPPADADIDFGTDTGNEQNPSDDNSNQPSSDGDEKSNLSREGGSGSRPAPQSTARHSDSKGRPSHSSATDSGDNQETDSSTERFTPDTPDERAHSSSLPPNPSYDTDDGAGIVPFGEAPASSDPMVVDVAEHVLNELTFQATATPNREVYSTLYADEDGLIRHHHIVDNPEFIKSRKGSISFSSEFFEHLQVLASQRKEIGHRLAGGCHSHPISGCPQQSPEDKQFTKKIWQTRRNTAFVVGINEGSGPDEWTITDDGYEVKRQSNEYLVRIRAFSGETEPKRIRLHQDMGK